MDKTARQLALGAHLLIIGGILLNISYYGGFLSSLVASALAICMTLTGKFLATAPAQVTGQDSALRTSLSCDVIGLILSGMVIMGLFSSMSTIATVIVAMGLVGLGSSIFFLLYLGGTAQHFAEQATTVSAGGQTFNLSGAHLVQVYGYLWKGIGLIFLLAILGFIIGPLLLLVSYVLLPAWLLGYVFLIAGTGLFMAKS